jgi:hypothetical protein
MTRYSVDNLAVAIDKRHDARQSIVLRYRNALCFNDLGADAARFRALQERTSIAEGLRIFSLGTYRDVQIDILDETSLMHTRTLKSIDGCVSTAHCLLRGYRSVVFESGGNTGVALTRYATRAGLATHCFVPAQNLTLLDGSLFDGHDTHLIAVEDPRQVKASARAFAAQQSLPLVPEVAWRYHASMFVGCFLAEHLPERAGYDYLVQAISAAFGPIGIYRVLGEHVAQLPQLPRFLGVQQESNCAMVRSWRASPGLSTHPRRQPADPLLAMVMYDTEPQTHGTAAELHRLLRTTGGDLMTINHGEFERSLQCRVGGPDLLRGLEANGVAIATVDGEVLEKTGLLGLAGILNQVETGRIQPGTRVLVCLTGGTARPRRSARPESYVRAAEAPDTGATGAGTAR